MSDLVTLEEKNDEHVHVFTYDEDTLAGALTLEFTSVGDLLSADTKALSAEVSIATALWDDVFGGKSPTKAEMSLLRLDMKQAAIRLVDTEEFQKLLEESKANTALRVTLGKQDPATKAAKKDKASKLKAMFDEAENRASNLVGKITRYWSMNYGYVPLNKNGEPLTQNEAKAIVAEKRTVVRDNLWGSDSQFHKYKKAGADAVTSAKCSDRLEFISETFLAGIQKVKVPAYDDVSFEAWQKKNK
jgi:hypothetical protein